MSHSFGRLTGGWQHCFFSLKVSYGERYSLGNEAPSTAVMSLELAMGIIFSPAWCMLYSSVGKSGTPVWSQLVFINTWAFMSARNTTLKLCGDIFPAIEHFPVHVAHSFEFS